MVVLVVPRSDLIIHLATFARVRAEVAVGSVERRTGERLLCAHNAMRWRWSREVGGGDVG